MKKFAVFIVICFVLAGSVFLMYRRFRQKQAPLSVGEITPASPGESPADVERREQKTASDKVFSEAIIKISETDKDLDGLTDVEEKKYGTDPTKADTDGDGILDKDEITIYHSDPLKRDTDGDGNDDGYEVARGYSPIGKGRLVF